jgi:prophage regulatory protein
MSKSSLAVVKSEEESEREKMPRPEKLVRFRDVQGRVPFCRAHLYGLIKAGKFPRPVSLVQGGRAVAFKESDIDAWIESRV